MTATTTAKGVNSKWLIAVIQDSIYYLPFTLFAVPTFGAFLDTPVTARAAALGGTGVAIADDASALVINPAGLGSLRRPEAVSDYSRLMAGLSDGSQISQFYLGGAYPLPFGGTAAVGWKELNFDGLYKERTLSFGYGRWWTPQVALGFGVKQLYHAFSADSQIVDDFGNIQRGTPDLFAENGTSKSAYSADLGVLYKKSAQTTIGLAVQDMNEPNVALSSNDRDVVARAFRMGLASEVRSGLTLASGVYTKQTLADQRDWIWTGAVEGKELKTASGEFGLRASLAAGTRDYRQAAVGAGFTVGNLQMDYAFAMLLSGLTFGDTAGSHRFTLTYHFGKPAKPFVKLPEPTARAYRSIDIEFIGAY